MDELSALIDPLTKEVTGLERSLQLREAREAASVAQAEARVAAAEARVAQAIATLKAESAALVIVEKQRSQLLARINGWQGQFWRIGYGTAVALTAPMLTTSVPLALNWLGGNWAMAIVGGQAALFAGLYFLIPAKR